ncbi:hypothetical protein BJ742DRAFT_741175 [Cladochytrium replicatum]|nr:hypothetical protein BJ742DRAFT_741175 [Cladochytrium replicatum]
MGMLNSVWVRRDEEDEAEAVVPEEVVAGEAMDVDEDPNSEPPIPTGKTHCEVEGRCVIGYYDSCLLLARGPSNRTDPYPNPASCSTAISADPRGYYCVGEEFKPAHGTLRSQFLTEGRGSVDRERGALGGLPNGNIEVGVHLCSLMSNVDRLAFSALWESRGLNCVPRLMIHLTGNDGSRASLTYDEAQVLLDYPAKKAPVSLGLLDDFDTFPFSVL